MAGVLFDSGNKNLNINLHQSIITAENVNVVFASLHVPKVPSNVRRTTSTCIVQFLTYFALPFFIFAGPHVKEFDFLSIDIDYNDYWVWKALDDSLFRPRIVCVEVNSNLPHNESKTVAYNTSHVWDGSIYFGARLVLI